jgi:hypothetical protein
MCVCTCYCVPYVGDSVIIHACVLSARLQLCMCVSLCTMGARGACVCVRESISCVQISTLRL